MTRVWILGCLAALVVATTGSARPPIAQEVSEPEVEFDRVGDEGRIHTPPQKVLQDTVWIADWTFDPGGPCSAAGWVHVDNHILNDGANYWHIESTFTSPAGIAGNSAAVGYHGNLCCVQPDGYANDWYQAIRMEYSGTATLSIDYMVDSEVGYDILQVETDSACASFDRVDLASDPERSAATFRHGEGTVDGLNVNGEWNAVPLTDHGPGTHCLYIAFFAGGHVSPCDGEQVSSVGEGAVVDNISIADASGNRFEDFDDGTLDIGTFMNIADSAPFGTWARLFRPITDNDLCTENTSCAWLWTDYRTPSLANDPSRAYGPGGFVVKNWLDDIIVAPWVSLAATPAAVGTVLQFRRFGGNFFTNGRIVQNWSVRSRGTAVAPSCISGWGHASQWNSLSSHAWVTYTFDMSSSFAAAAEELQVRFRTSDWHGSLALGRHRPFGPDQDPSSTGCGSAGVSSRAP